MITNEGDIIKFIGLDGHIREGIVICPQMIPPLADEHQMSGFRADVDGAGFWGYDVQIIALNGEDVK